MLIFLTNYCLKSSINKRCIKCLNSSPDLRILSLILMSFVCLLGDKELKREGERGLREEEGKRIQLLDRNSLCRKHRLCAQDLLIPRIAQYENITPCQNQKTK